MPLFGATHVLTFVSLSFLAFPIIGSAWPLQFSTSVDVQYPARAGILRSACRNIAGSEIRKIHRRAVPAFPKSITATEESPWPAIDIILKHAEIPSRCCTCKQQAVRMLCRYYRLFLRRSSRSLRSAVISLGAHRLYQHQVRAMDHSRRWAGIRPSRFGVAVCDANRQ